MNCLTPRSRRRKHVEPSAPPYYPPQPPYNPEFFENTEGKADSAPAWGVCYVRYTVTSYEDEDNTGGRGRRSLYEGVNWMPVSARVLLLVCIAPHALAALTHHRATLCVVCNETLYLLKT